jgi:hypothetical protein
MEKNLKKPYKKPVIKSERIIETAALACGKCFAGGVIGQAACQ